MRLSLFTAADDSYYPFLLDMLDSLPEGIDVTVFSEKLSERPSGVRVVEADPSLLKYSSLRRAGVSYAFSLGVRPFLPELAPGADVVAWVDADVWFQGDRGIRDLIKGADFGAISIVPEVGPAISYVNAHESYESFSHDLASYFGEEAREKYHRYPIMNGGLFAARADSPVWRAWREDFDRALSRVDGTLDFGIDQASLNYCILSRGLDFSPLPYEYNYSARLPMTMIEGELRTNTFPFTPVRAVHLIGKSKWEAGNLVRRSLDGRVVDVVRTRFTRADLLNISRS